jgi:hypothetical protein
LTGYCLFPKKSTLAPAENKDGLRAMLGLSADGRALSANNFPHFASLSALRARSI